MEDGQPSFTALTAAAARAAHLVVDREPVIFADALAVPLLGERADELLSYHTRHGTHPVLAGARAQVCCRSRYSEDALARAIGRGVTQYVILGAGLDSFGYRSALAREVAVFEVDHPATQEWKRARLAAAGITPPGRLAFVPADLETDSLIARLEGAGFSAARPALVSWLGVTMYLTRAAIDATLAQIAALAPGTELIADYMLPPRLRDETGSSYVEQVMPVAAQHGEPWLTFLGPDQAAALLAGHGFASEHVRQRDLIDPALWARGDGLRPIELSMVARAYR